MANDRYRNKTSQPINPLRRACNWHLVDGSFHRHGDVAGHDILHETGMKLVLHTARLLTTVALVLLAITVATKAQADSCKSLYDDYTLLVAQQSAQAKNLRGDVFDLLSRKTCSEPALQILDAYIRTLQKLVGAQAKAFPCDDGDSNNIRSPRPGLDPQKILDSAETARNACFALLGRNPIADQPEPVASGQDVQRSASCSDITGTGSTTPAATNCKDAGTFLHAARVARKKYPEYSADQYKKAAASYRLAGDVPQAEAALREAALSIEAFEAQQSAAELPCAASMGDAESYITGAEVIEKNDPSCAGLTQAAENYFTAGKIFFGKVKPGQREQVEKSCEFKLTNLMFQRRDALNDFVDRMKREGRCEPGMRISPQPPAANPKNAGTDKEQHKKDCVDMLRKLAPHAPSPEWLEHQMGNSGCKPDGTPMSMRERVKWELSKGSTDQ